MYLLADKIPQAVLSYKEGLRLNPNHEPLRANLEYARAQVNYPPSGRGHPESEAWPSWLYQPSPFQAFIAAFVLVAIGSLLFTRWMMLPQSGSLRYSLPFLVLAAAAGVLWWHLENRMRYDEEYPLVVIAQEHTPLLRGNGPSYPRHPDLPELARGMEARRILQRGDWLQVRLASGEVGWVPRSAVLVDER